MCESATSQNLNSNSLNFEFITILYHIKYAGLQAAHKQYIIKMKENPFGIGSAALYIASLRSARSDDGHSRNGLSYSVMASVSMRRWSSLVPFAAP